MRLNTTKIANEKKERELTIHKDIIGVVSEKNVAKFRNSFLICFKRKILYKLNKWEK